jgi:hypothetical protein
MVFGWSVSLLYASNIAVQRQKIMRVTWVCWSLFLLMNLKLINSCRSCEIAPWNPVETWVLGFICYPFLGLPLFHKISFLFFWIDLSHSLLFLCRVTWVEQCVMVTWTWLLDYIPSKSTQKTDFLKLHDLKKIIGHGLIPCEQCS